MSHWTLSLSDPWFTHMKNGEKLYEGRLFRGLPKYFKSGDTITFYHDSNQNIPPLTTQIINIHRSSTFTQSLEYLPIKDVLPGVVTIDEGTQIYLKFASIDSQTKFGVCQIEIRKI